MSGNEFWKAANQSNLKLGALRLCAVEAEDIKHVKVISSKNVS